MDKWAFLYSRNKFTNKMSSELWGYPTYNDVTTLTTNDYDRTTQGVL
jgi:hypothetical protein